MEPPTELLPDPKKLKRMKKKLDELNRKIRHSKKKNNELIHKRNSLRKVIESLKTGSGVKPKPKPEWIFRDSKRAFGGAYRSYRVNGRPKMDADTFFSRIKKGLIDLIKRELKTRTSAKIQTTTWIRFTRDEDRSDMVFKSLMTNVYRGSDLDQIVDRMFSHMKTQIENPVLLNSRFVFDEVLFLDINFHQLNLMRGSSYLPLPNYMVKKKAVINPQNRDKECFKWAFIAADRWMDIDSHPERVTNLREFVDNYDWSGLEFPDSVKEIGKFETKNNVSIKVLGLEGKDIYIHGNSNYRSDREINLLMISENGTNHYTAIKSLSRLLSSSNSKHKGKQYFCTNCLQGFSLESSRNKH